MLCEGDLSLAGFGKMLTARQAVCLNVCNRFLHVLDRLTIPLLK